MTRLLMLATGVAIAARLLSGSVDVHARGSMDSTQERAECAARGDRPEAAAASGRQAPAAAAPNAKPGEGAWKNYGRLVGIDEVD